MFKKLLLKELHLNLMNLRFQVAFIIVLTLFITGSIFNIKGNIEKQKLYDKYYSQWLENIRQQAGSNASELAVSARDFLFGPSRNSFISDCKERFIPNVVTYSAFSVSDFDVRQSISNPLLNKYEEINWSFIVICVISLLALLLTFDAISGEREAHTLVLLLSNPVSRSQIFLAKWLSILLVLAITIFTGILISLVIQISSGSLIINGSTATEVILFFLFSLVFSALMTCMGLLCSVVTRNSNVSLLYAVALWLVFSIVIPNTSILWAYKIYPIESSSSFSQRIYLKTEEIQDSYPPEKWSADEKRPFIPGHKIRAAMNMEVMLSNKQMTDSYYQTMFHQYEKSRNIICISPLSLFGFGMETITGGGYLRFQHNWKAIHVYQEQLLDFFKKIDTKDDESPHWYNPWNVYSTTHKPVPFEEVPLYSEKTIPISDRVVRMSQYTGLMIIYILVLATAAFIKFLRSDVR
jgi:ABC-type transport system involved in multi-copper enzyme maturation permease subunit